MKEVLQRLRRENSKAVEEAVELTVAVGEILRAEERLDAGLRELAAESFAILALADDSVASRLENLAAYAGRLSEALRIHVSAFRELKKALDGWKVQSQKRGGFGNSGLRAQVGLDALEQSTSHFRLGPAEHEEDADERQIGLHHRR